MSRVPLIEARLWEEVLMSEKEAFQGGLSTRLQQCWNEVGEYSVVPHSHDKRRIFG